MSTPKRERLVPIFVTADELVMLRDRVGAGAEVSEESGWDELLTKVEKAQRAAAWQPDPRNAKYAHPDAERRFAVDAIVSKFWPPGYHSIREVTDAILAYVETLAARTPERVPDAGTPETEMPADWGWEDEGTLANADADTRIWLADADTLRVVTMEDCSGCCEADIPIAAIEMLTGQRLAAPAQARRRKRGDVSELHLRPEQRVVPGEVRWATPHGGYRVFPWMGRWSWNHAEAHDGFEDPISAEFDARMHEEQLRTVAYATQRAEVHAQARQDVLRLTAENVALRGDMQSREAEIDWWKSAAGETAQNLAVALEALKLANDNADRAAERPVDPDEYLILDRRSAVGNCGLWWGPNGNGYVCSFDEAGRYSKADAHAKRETDVPVPVSLARKFIVQHIRVDQLCYAIDLRPGRHSTEERVAMAEKWANRSHNDAEMEDGPDTIGSTQWSDIVPSHRHGPSFFRGRADQASTDETRYVDEAIDLLANLLDCGDYGDALDDESDEEIPTDAIAGRQGAAIEALAAMIEAAPIDNEEYALGRADAVAEGET